MLARIRRTARGVKMGIIQKEKCNYFLGICHCDLANQSANVDK
jgi:hypothetical protein